MRETDIAVVGAGAAGLMAAIQAAEALKDISGSKRPSADALVSGILLFDSRAKIGAKILISGGTRCNVTNRDVTPKDFHGGPSHFVRHVLEACTPQKTILFFKKIGVELVLEPTGKYFPATHSGRTVLAALLAALGAAGVELVTGFKLKGVKKDPMGFLLEFIKEDGPNETVAARRLVLATGGLSYPETGSDGGGLEIAERLGHTIVKTAPALTPLLTDHKDWKSLSGIAIETRLSFFLDEKKSDEVRGAMLFTHFGFSGPAALDVSRHVSSSPPGSTTRIEASFLPDHTGESLKKALKEARRKHPQKRVKTFLHENMALPERWVEVFLKKIDGDPDLPIGRLTGSQRSGLIRFLLNYPLETTSVFGYKKAEVTAGGVELRQVNVGTMESKIVPGLYFAGEILDVDGRIGGFNFQWAWSTGAIAGRAAAKSL